MVIWQRLRRHFYEEPFDCNRLDVTNPGQMGLALRPFEALGQNKKLITTNGNISDYEFYHLSNVMAVEAGKVLLKMEFF